MLHHSCSSITLSTDCRSPNPWLLQSLFLVTICTNIYFVFCKHICNRRRYRAHFAKLIQKQTAAKLNVRTTHHPFKASSDGEWRFQLNLPVKRTYRTTVTIRKKTTYHSRAILLFYCLCARQYSAWCGAARFSSLWDPINRNSRSTNTTTELVITENFSSISCVQLPLELQVYDFLYWPNVDGIWHDHCFVLDKAGIVLCAAGPRNQERVWDGDSRWWGWLFP